MASHLAGVEAVGNIIIPTKEILYAWQTDAYPHGERRKWMPAYALTLIVISTILVILRLILRLRRHGGGFGLDDALLVPSWMLLVAFTVVVVWSAESGTLDRHMWDVNPTKYQTVALSAWIGQLIFLVGTCLIRISILLFYRRMVKGTFKRRWKYSVWVAIGITLVWSLAFSIMIIATCTPVEASWRVFDPYYTEDWTCVDTRISNTAAGVLAVISDCYSLLLPWSMIWPLEMPRRQKLALNMVFSFGIVVVAAAACRTYFSSQLGKDYDSTWVGFWVYFFTLLEWNLAIICNCAPSLRAFFRTYLKDSVDKALNSFSTRSRYKETNTDGTTVSHNNIELKRSITVESEKPLNVRARDRENDSDSESSQRLEPVLELPQAHLQDKRKTFLDMKGSPPQFVPTRTPWSESQVNIVVTGPEEAKRSPEHV